LPGYGDDGSTLEIFSYNELVEPELPSANQRGFGHIAFAVDDVDESLQAVIAAGGSTVGNIVTTEVDGVGFLLSASCMREIRKEILLNCRSGVRTADRSAPCLCLDELLLLTGSYRLSRRTASFRI